MCKILGPLVRHLWAWHKATSLIILFLLAYLAQQSVPLTIGLGLCGLGWVLTDLHGHAVIHHPHEWTADVAVRWVATVIAVVGLIVIVRWTW